MAHYTGLLEDSEIEAESDSESDSEVEEDPDFPLPRDYSEDKGDQGSPLPILTSPMHTPTLQSTPSPRGKTYMEKKIGAGK